MNKIGLIGGSGLEKLNIFANFQEIALETPYGAPSSNILKGNVDANEVYILSRHGRKHEIPPHSVNNRANISALKTMGVEAVIATSACGSLRQEINRGDLVIPDQLIDFTKNRISTFHDSFTSGTLVHISLADPFDSKLRTLIISSAKRIGMSVHAQGTMITIEGPRFSTRAESRMFQAWGADIINMSIAPEAALAREASLPYSVIALSTDFDSWKEDDEAVSWEEVLKVFKQNVSKVEALIRETIAHFNM